MSLMKYPLMNMLMMIKAESPITTRVFVLRFARYRNHCSLSLAFFLIIELILLDSWVYEVI